jgi:heptosyltransferase-1
LKDPVRSALPEVNSVGAKKILLVKLSSLGDVVHTLPVVQDILAAYPGAQIDWVVEKSFAPLLQPLLAPGAGLRRIIPCEIRRWRKSFWTAATRAAWSAFKTQLQQDRYDAVIDLHGLTKSALVARLARLNAGGQRFAMANQTDGSGYEAPTRWLASKAITLPRHIHAVQRGRELSAQALAYPLAASPDYGLKPLVTQAANTQYATVAFVHGTSRADKQWPMAHWIALGQQLMASGYWIVLPHGSADELATSQAIAAALNADGEYNSDERTGSPSSRGRGVGFAGPQAQRPPEGLEPAAPSLLEQGGTGDRGDASREPRPARPRVGHSDEKRGGSIVWPRLALDALTEQLAQCAGVIGVDSGLSHIAVALDLPHVQIYNFDTAWRTGPLPAAAGQASSELRQRSVFAQPTPTVDMVWDAWLSCQPVTDSQTQDLA